MGARQEKLGPSGHTEGAQWSGRRDYCAGRAWPAVDAAGEGDAAGRGGGVGRLSFRGCPPARDLEEPAV